MKSKTFYGESCKLIKPGVVVSCEEGNWRAGPHLTPRGAEDVDELGGFISLPSPGNVLSMGSVKVG